MRSNLINFHSGREILLRAEIFVKGWKLPQQDTLEQHSKPCSANPICQLNRHLLDYAMKEINPEKNLFALVEGKIYEMSLDDKLSKENSDSTE